MNSQGTLSVRATNDPLYIRPSTCIPASCAGHHRSARDDPAAGRYSVATYPAARRSPEPSAPDGLAGAQGAARAAALDAHSPAVERAVAWWLSDARGVSCARSVACPEWL